MSRPICSASCAARAVRDLFTLDAREKIIRNAQTIARIRALVIPPAWQTSASRPTRNRTCRRSARMSRGGCNTRLSRRLDAGARQGEGRSGCCVLGKALPKIRARIEKDLARRKTDRRYAAAVAGRLIDRALIRSGHSGSDEGGRGATTLLNRDVQLNGTKVYLNFTGKSGQVIRKTIHDPILPHPVSRNLKNSRMRISSRFVTTTTAAAG